MAYTLWFTGLSGAGKTTLAQALVPVLRPFHSLVVLDGDDVRRHLNKDLGFTDQDRDENIRRIANVARILNSQQINVIVSAITPFNLQRELARSVIETGGANFELVHIKCSLEICEQRDVKSLYKMARLNNVPRMTGIDSRFDEPTNASLVIDTSTADIDRCRDMILEFMDNKFEIIKQHPELDNRWRCANLFDHEARAKYQAWAEGITQHQNNPMYHPFTCGVNSEHANLVPRLTTGGQNVLVCLTCGYVQTMI